MGDQQPTRARMRLAVVAGLVVVGAGTATVWLKGQEPAAREVPLPAGQFPEPGIEHTHGLGVDPADGVLYAATHFGLLRLEDGRMTRVANRYQDTMGFEVVGPGRFLGSGHPDFREDNPPLLGLIESTDGGQSWTPLSLRGEADFHAIGSAHDRIYAYDSTSETFMVSGDGRSWDRRSQLVVLDFAVSPQDPDLVVAATEAGPRTSTDGGRTWASLAGAPDLAVLSWDDELVAVSQDGGVHASEDRGRTWSARGRVGGEPEAMTVAAVDGRHSIFVAVAERGILRSRDGGHTFQVFYRGR
ncbi:MAG: exo-alpha-sialidase [Mycobacteriales bacterium]